MKPLFKHILLRINKEIKKEETFDDLFGDKAPKKLRSEATLVGFAEDCHEQVHPLINKQVLWNGKYLETVEETEEYKTILTEQDSLIAEL